MRGKADRGARPAALLGANLGWHGVSAPGVDPVPTKVGTYQGRAYSL